MIIFAQIILKLSFTDNAKMSRKLQQNLTSSQFFQDECISIVNFYPAFRFTGAVCFKK